MNQDGAHRPPAVTFECDRFFWLQRYRCPVAALREWEPLAGDASLRRFYRVRLATQGTVVVSIFPEPEPFRNQLRIYATLRKLPWPIPAIYSWDLNPPRIWMEDAGSLTLAHAWATHPAEKLFQIYDTLIDAWLRLQDLGPDLADDHPIQRRRLDRARFLFELNFFRENFIEKYLNINLSRWDQYKLNKYYHRLTKALDSMPKAICHRDFHSRNVLITPAGIRIVDYQDMQWGPAPYDIVSLLLDAYVRLPDAWVESLQRRARDRFPWDQEMWQLVALQRHLKALGTFGYQIHKRKKWIYQSAVHRTLSYLLQGEELAALRGFRPFRTLFETAWDPSLPYPLDSTCGTT